MKGKAVKLKYKVKVLSKCGLVFQYSRHQTAICTLSIPIRHLQLVPGLLHPNRRHRVRGRVGLRGGAWPRSEPASTCGLESGLGGGRKFSRFEAKIGRCVQAWLELSTLQICWKINACFLKKWAIPVLFLFIFYFSIQLTVNVQYKWLDSNRGPLELETTTLPTQQQSLHYELNFSADNRGRHLLCGFVCVYHLRNRVRIPSHGGL